MYSKIKTHLIISIKLCVIIFISFFNGNIFGQYDINIKFSETEINKVLAALVDAHGLNYGDYTGTLGLEAWYINVDRAEINILPNNRFTLNVDVAACVNIDLWIFGGFPIVIHPNFDFSGRLDIQGNAVDGYKLKLLPIRIEHVIENAIVNALPDIEINLGVSIFARCYSRSL